MSSSHALLRYLRLLHLYTGVFIAPAVLFFAFTGALQTFSLHETTRGSNYKPPAWAVMLAQIHKKQTPIVPAKKAPSSNKPSDKATAPEMAAQDKLPSPSAYPAQPAPISPAPTEATTPRSHNTLPLKCFFLLVSIGLFVSTLSGLYMSCKYIRNKGLITALILAGIIVPILFTIF